VVQSTYRENNEGNGMSRKKEICLVIDVETAGGFAAPLVYDLGVAAVVRATGEILERHSLVVREVFFDRRDDMASAYYADKLPLYFRGIKNGSFRVVTLRTARNIVGDMVARYGIKRAYAYNAKFDSTALDSTLRQVWGYRVKFLPRGVKWCCIWHLACASILSQKRYRKFATANGLVSDAGNLRTSAEAAYAYLTGNPTFEEAHTGLADVEIEAEILAYCLRQKGKVREDIVHNPWRIPQQKKVA
jgi:hypothetical protein